MYGAGSQGKVETQEGMVVDNNTNNAISLLEEGGIPFSDEMCTQLQQYLGLIREWNAFASLVSVRDLNKLEDHVVDSLSLVPYAYDVAQQGGILLDVGSGGGFPAIPMKIALPGLRVVLVERSERKTGFLVKVAGALRLEAVRVQHGEFPNVGESGMPALVTARAVEKLERLIPRIVEYLPVGATFLCQHTVPEAVSRVMFDISRVEDSWTANGLRRSALYRIMRRP